MEDDVDLNLDGSKKQKLRKALISSFPGWDPMKQMTSDYLELQLPTITAEVKGLEAQAFDLITWAHARGRVKDLVLGARIANPGNPALLEFAQELGLTSSVESRRTLEAFVGDNRTFVDVAVWRTQLSKLEWRMCRVDVNEVGAGTGFLIGPDVVLTNHHVVRQAIARKIQPKQLSCLFDFKVAENKVLSTGVRFKLGDGDNWNIGFSPHSAHDLEHDPKSGEPSMNELDFALLRLAEPAGELPAGGFANGEARGWVGLSDETLDFSTIHNVAILQHPRREPLKLATGTNETITLNGAGNRIRYAVPTQPGSSGSPVFDSDWDIVALHHSGDPDTVKPEYNEGIPMSVIAQHPAVADYLATL